MNPHASITNEGNFAPVDLFAGDFPRVARKVTILAGAGALTPGTVLGRITTGGKYVVSASASSDGSQTPNAILAQSVTVGGTDAEAIVYFTGEFRPEKLTFGAGHTAASTRIGLRSLSIFI